ncbi:MAG TPA: endonuclease III [Caulobacteraceae bacterium]
MNLRDRLRLAAGGGFKGGGNDFRDGGSRLDPLSQLVRSSLGSRTRDEVSWPAYQRLRRAFPAWSRLAETPPEEVEALIADVTFAREKAERLGQTIAMILLRTGALRLDFLTDAPVEDAVAWLQRLPGVGYKVACAVLNFSTLHRRVMVVDTHVWRVARRLGLVSPRASAEAVSRAIMSLAPRWWTAEDYYDLHQLMKGLSQTLCRHDVTYCQHCPLAEVCPRISQL